jgi:hypothetical protein
MSELRLRPILLAGAIGAVLHLAVMGIVAGNLFHPYWWMAFITGISVGLIAAGKQLYSKRRETTVHSG